MLLFRVILTQVVHHSHLEKNYISLLQMNLHSYLHIKWYSHWGSWNKLKRKKAGNVQCKYRFCFIFIKFPHLPSSNGGIVIFWTKYMFLDCATTTTLMPKSTCSVSSSCICRKCNHSMNSLHYFHSGLQKSNKHYKCLWKKITLFKNSTQQNPILFFFKWFTCTLTGHY